jgi:hypothetical protein
MNCFIQYVIYYLVALFKGDSYNLDAGTGTIGVYAYGVESGGAPVILANATLYKKDRQHQ